MGRLNRNTMRMAVGLIGPALCLLLPLATRAADSQETGPFAAVPLGDPSYPQIASVERDLYGSVLMGGRRENTHYECVVVLTDAVSALTSVPTTESRFSLHPRADAKARLEADPQALAGLHVLLRRFAPMARVMNEKMGLGDVVVNAGLAYFRPPFPDVPPGHWAASSVERLRKAGLLIGYHAPDPSDGRGWQLLPPPPAGRPAPPESFNAPPVHPETRLTLP